MVGKIEEWIEQTLANYSNRRVSCDRLSSYFNGFYPSEFLAASHFVVVDKIPKPDFPELRHAGLGDFLDMDVEGITYKNTYFVIEGQAEHLDLHFHELVHVLQWQYLGAKDFISRYINEVQTFGYEAAPLEEMAYFLGDYFAGKGKPFDIPSYVQEKI